MRNRSVIISFSHLRWNFVYQRPQHLLSRLARNRPVYFFEEPVFDREEPHLEISRPEPGVTVLRPHTPLESRGFSDDQIPVLQRLLADFLSCEETEGERIAWLYTPMALPLLEKLQPHTIVYDCMDELSAFLHAPPQLAERETHLFHLADLVFTGGPSLYQAKKDRHSNVFCFPSSVDTEHFARGVRESAEAPDQALMTRPRLGYYGVIDERIDLELLEQMADKHPEWQIIMVGPVVKIDPVRLPRRANIHYIGQRDYRDLPAYLKGWDVCLLPFALNASTRYISPTKVLEYMAGQKLIASTPITDVAEPYGSFVYIGHGPQNFIECCEQALQASREERQRRLTEASNVLARTSWDRTVRTMEELLDKAATSSPMTAISPATEPPVAIIGAGPTGLSAAYHLGERALLIEKNAEMGGWCRSIEQDGFTFDYAGHIMFSADPYVHQLYQMLLGDNVHWQDREAWIWSKNVYTRYPFQGSLYGLPAEVIRECIVGAIEARFGALKQNRKGGGNGSAAGGANGTNGACKTNGAVNDCCADGILESSVALAKPAMQASEPSEPRNFEEFIYKVWGAGIARHFAIPYNRKLWAVPLSEMETSWLGGRVPMPDLEEMIEGALKPAPKPMGPNARFGYPLRGGFQSLMNGFLPHLKGETLLNTAVVSIDPEARTLTLSDGTQRRYSQLISTMPLPALVRCLGPHSTVEIREAASALRFVSVRCVHIGVGRENLTEKHWIYYPEDTVFHRIFVQGNASPYCNPSGGFGLTCEITYSPYKPLPCDGEELIERCIADCRKVGIFGSEDPVWTAVQCDLPYAYVVYDHSRKQAVETIREWLKEKGILLAGRYSEWEYYNSDHAFIAGKKAADMIRTMESEQLERPVLSTSRMPIELSRLKQD
jgi:UDP-galactopyranose mutase